MKQAGLVFISMVALNCPLSRAFAAISGTVLVTFVDGVSSSSDSPIVESAATGELLAGIEVTVFFDDGSQETALWSAIGPESGAASGATWSLSQLGDTIVGSWYLQNDDVRAIAACIIDGAGGAALFDTTFDGEFGTPGTGAGLSIRVNPTGTSNAEVQAVYRDTAGVEGGFGIGDLFRFLEIYFVSIGGLATGDSLVFEADVDLLELAVPVLPTGDVDLSESVELADFALLGECFAGPEETVPPPLCLPEIFDRTDLDRDGDTDLADFSAWSLALSRDEG